MRGVGGRGLSLDDRRGRFFKTLARRASLKGGALATRTVGIDALADLGVSHIEMPATPERVWRAIQAARATGG